MKPASFGLTLPNRAIILGAVQTDDLVRLTRRAEESGAFDTVWIGDSMLAMATFGLYVPGWAFIDYPMMDVPAVGSAPRITFSVTVRVSTSMKC